MNTPKQRKMNEANRYAKWKTLTPLLIRTLEYFWDYKEREGYLPSYREAGEHFGVSHCAIEHRMWSLERLGYIEKVWKSPRAMRFVKDRRSWRVPSVDKVAYNRMMAGLDGWDGRNAKKG
jgi:SOS-response transcriptional repressor LexA